MDSQERIDFVVPWVDGADGAWQEAFRAAGGDACPGSSTRFRDWDLMRYWFRGVEKFAPWAGRIHFITWGHLPPWLDAKHPRLNIVRHEDYIPREYLPTFSSHVIELNLHRIPGLAGRFVYFNDDTFLTAPTRPEHFFRGGLPCDAAIEAPIIFQQAGVRAETIDMAAINRNFTKRSVVFRNFTKWWNLRYGAALAKTFFSLPYGRFLGFLTEHLPNSYLKSTFSKVWQKEGALLDASCRHRFRDFSDANQWIFKYWQLASGSFAPRKPGFGKFFEGAGRLDDAERAIREGKTHSVCWNDADDITDFESAKLKLSTAFNAILPNKCSFENHTP